MFCWDTLCLDPSCQNLFGIPKLSHHVQNKGTNRWILLLLPSSTLFHFTKIILRHCRFTSSCCHSCAPNEWAYSKSERGFSCSLDSSKTCGDASVPSSENQSIFCMAKDCNAVTPKSTGALPKGCQWNGKNCRNGAAKMQTNAQAQGVCKSGTRRFRTTLPPFCLSFSSDSC